MGSTCCRVKQVEHVFAVASGGPHVEANRWLIADEHIEMFSVQPASFVLAVGHSLVRTGALEIHHFGPNIQYATSWSGIDPPGDVPVLDTAEQSDEVRISC